MYFIQAEVKVRGRYRRLYFGNNDCWQESRSLALPYPSRAEAEAVVERLAESGRRIRAFNVVHADEVTAPYRKQTHRPVRRRWRR